MKPVDPLWTGSGPEFPFLLDVIYPHSLWGGAWWHQDPRHQCQLGLLRSVLLKMARYYPLPQHTDTWVNDHKYHWERTEKITIVYTYYGVTRSFFLGIPYLLQSSTYRFLFFFLKKGPCPETIQMIVTSNGEVVITLLHRPSLIYFIWINWATPLLAAHLFSLKVPSLINHHYSSSQVKPPSMLLQPSTHYDNCTHFISHDWVPSPDLYYSEVTSSPLSRGKIAL